MKNRAIKGGEPEPGCCKSEAETEQGCYSTGAGLQQNRSRFRARAKQGTSSTEAENRKRKNIFKGSIPSQRNECIPKIIE